MLNSSPAVGKRRATKCPISSTASVAAASTAHTRMAIS
jgi:hypothetical protein